MQDRHHVADRCLLLAHRENFDEVPVARNCSSLLRVIVPAQKRRRPNCRQG
jgi:hypothetical protein